MRSAHGQRISEAQYEMLVLLQSHGTAEHAEESWSFRRDTPARLVAAGAARTLEACIRHGWVERASDDYVITREGEHMIAALEGDE